MKQKKNINKTAHIEWERAIARERAKKNVSTLIAQCLKIQTTTDKHKCLNKHV